MKRKGNKVVKMKRAWTRDAIEGKIYSRPIFRSHNIAVLEHLPDYLIIRGGNIISTRRPGVIHLMSPRDNGRGYLRCSLVNRDGKPVFWSVHHLMMSAFGPRPPEGIKNLTVNHKDGNKQNNDVDNLEWVSLKDNIREFHAMKREKLNAAKNTGDRLGNKQAA